MSSTFFRAALGVSACLLAFTAFGQVPAKLSAADKQFVNLVGSGNLAEIEMGRLALELGTSPAVKEYGQRLVGDHTRANADLEKTVAVYGEALPTKVDAADQRHLDMLKRKKGADFEATFARHMVEGHEKMIKLFKAEAASGGAEPLKQFALRTLQTLEQHLQLAKDLTRVKTSSL